MSQVDILAVFAHPDDVELAVGGTLGADTIVISPADTVGYLGVTFNGALLGTYKPTGHILVYSQTGNDTTGILNIIAERMNGRSSVSDV